MLDMIDMGWGCSSVVKAHDQALSMYKDLDLISSTALKEKEKRGKQRGGNWWPEAERGRTVAIQE